MDEKSSKESGKTKLFDVWYISCVAGYELKCADDHIVQTKEGLKYVKDLTYMDFVKTKDGFRRIISIKRLNEKRHMYDLLNVKDKLYITNDIISHNTTVVSSYALWYSMFHNKKFVGIVSNKFESAKDFLARIKDMYELLPIYLKPGVSEYNKHSVTFENGTRIQIAATSPSSFRGRSIHLLVCLSKENKIKIKNKFTNELKHVQISELVNILKNQKSINKKEVQNF